MRLATVTHCQSATSTAKESKRKFGVATQRQAAISCTITLRVACTFNRTSASRCNIFINYCTGTNWQELCSRGYNCQTAGKFLDRLAVNTSYNALCSWQPDAYAAHLPAAVNQRCRRHDNCNHQSISYSPDTRFCANALRPDFVSKFSTRILQNT